MPNIKIFVSHRIDLNSVKVENSIYYPIRCGAAMDDNCDATMLGDDTGENISDKREYLGEFTVQYWAWKNVQADYYGLCHYRRYLSFSEKNFTTDEKSQVIEPYLSDESIHKHRLDDPEYIQSVVSNYDILVGEYADISRMYTPRGQQKNIYEHFAANDKLLIEKEDIDLVLATLDELYPDLGHSAHEYFERKKFRGYNCFILRKDLFFQLCTIETDILRAIAKSGKIDFTHRSTLEKRTYAFFCEWLYGIYIYHLEKQNKYKIKELQLVFFENTEVTPHIKPLDNSIAVTYLTNSYYLPMTLVSIESLVDSKKADSIYDIIVTHDGLSKEEIALTTAHFSGRKDISLRFVFFRGLVPTASNGIRWERKDNITYNYAFLPWILKNYTRVIYLHSDLLIYKDLSDLFRADLGDCCIAAPRDYLRICEARKESAIIELWAKKLNLNDYSGYFSTSVMLMDLDAIRESVSVDTMLRYSLGYYYPRDAMNKLYHQHVKLLQAEWNIFALSSPVIVELSNFLPEILDKDLRKFADAPSIFHYSMYPKPWDAPSATDAWRFWQIARNTPLYERLIANYCISLFPANRATTPTRESFPRRVSNILLPKGSLRRQVAKKLLPKGSKRWNFLKKLYYKLGGH